MGKIVTTALIIGAYGALTVATGGFGGLTGSTFLGFGATATAGAGMGITSTYVVAGIGGLTGVLGAAVAGAVLGAGLGVLSSVLAPSRGDMAGQSGQKVPVTNSVDSRKAIYGKVRVGGAEVFIEEFDTLAGDDVPNDTLVFVRAIADHPVHAFGQFWMGDQAVNFDGSGAVGDLAGNLWLQTRDGRQGTANGTLAGFNVGWTEDHVGEGIAYYFVRARFDQNKFPYGAGEIRRCSIEVEGKRLYDPRRDSTVAGGSGPHRLATPSTWEYSANPALCILDFLLDPDDALGNAVPLAEIDLASVMAAANICDEAVPAKSGGTLPRYSLNGIIDSARPKMENLRLMLTAMSGRMQWIGGKIHIYAAAGGFSTAASFDDDDIVAATYSALLPAGQRYNEVRGTFLDPAAGFEPAEYPAFVDAAAQAAEGEVVMNLNLPLCQDHREAQRHAKIALKMARRPVMTLEVGAAGLLVAPMDIVTVTHAPLGLENEDFRVVEHETLPPATGKPLTVRLGLIDETAALYDWNAATEELDKNASPALREVTGRETVAVAGLALSAVTLANADGSETAAVNVTWDAPGAAVASTIVDVRKSGTSVWRPGGVALRGDLDMLLEVPENMELDVRVRHQIASGLIGPEAIESITSNDVAGDGGISWDDAFRGAWAAGTTYAKGDVVTWQGSSYVYIAATPSAGNLPSNASFWAIMVPGARIASLQATGNSFSYDSDGAPDPAAAAQDIALTMLGQNLGASLSATAWAATGDVSGTISMGAPAAAKTFTTALFGSNKKVTITATCDGISDSVTIYRVKAGKNAYAAWLDNEAHVVPADASGAVLAYTGAGGAFVIERGGVDVSAEFDLSTLSNPQSLSVTYDNAHASVRSFTVTGGFDAGEAASTLKIRAAGKAGTDHEGKTFARVFSLGKAAQGSAGAAGSPGTNGTNGANGSNGTDALSVNAYPSALAIPCNSAGVPLSGLPATIQLSVFKGSTNVTASASYSRTVSGCSASSVSAGTFTINSVANDAGYVEVTVTHSGVSVKYRVTFAKTKGGTSGTSVVDTSLSINNATSYVGTGSATASQGGPATLALPAGKTIVCEVMHGFMAGSGAVNLLGRIEYRTTQGSGTWTALSEYTGESSPAAGEPGMLAFTHTFSGPASPGTWEIRYQNRKSSSSTVSAYGEQNFTVSYT